MFNMAQLAVHDFLSPHNLAAKGLPDTLVTEADAEYWHIFRSGFNQIEANTGLWGRTGRATNNRLRLGCENVFGRRLSLRTT